MNTPSAQSHEQEVRQRIIDLLRLTARVVVKRLRAEQKIDSARDRHHEELKKK